MSVTNNDGDKKINDGQTLDIDIFCGRHGLWPSWPSVWPSLTFLWPSFSVAVMLYRLDSGMFSMFGRMGARVHQKSQKFSKCFRFFCP